MDQSAVVLTRVIAIKILAVGIPAAITIWLIARWVLRVAERKEEVARIHLAFNSFVEPRAEMEYPVETPIPVEHR